MGESDLDKELRYHYEKLVRDFLAQGLDPAEARRRARLEFGGVDQVKEECRDVRGRWLEDLVKDLRYAARTMRRSPGFLVVSVLSLALGIGANTAIFSLIDAVMLRALPVQDPARLVSICRQGASGHCNSLSYAAFVHIRDHMRSITSSAIEMESNPAITIDGKEEILESELVTGDHYRMLGIQPAVGRLLEPADDAIDPAAPAAVISYGYWQRRFGGDPSVVGKTFVVHFNRRIYTIVGVTPAGYSGARVSEDPDLILPVSPLQSDENRHEPTFNAYDMLARLAPGVTIAQANAELQVVWQSFLQTEAPGLPERGRDRFLQQRAAVLEAGKALNPIRTDFSAPLMVLMGMTGLVLLLACVNLSGLLLARASARQREISIRLALGAGSGRLLRQFLTESALLALLGGAAGLALAQWLCRVPIGMLSVRRTMHLTTSPDWRILIFTAGISLAACVLAGIAPGWHVLRSNLNPGMKQKAGGNRGLGRALVIAQLAVSMVLMVGASLFVSTLVKLYGVDRGVRTDGVMVFRLRTSEQYRGGREWASMDALIDHLNAIPGVASASVADTVPLSGMLWDRDVEPEGSGHVGHVGFNAIAPKYFETLVTPLLAGRAFDQRDTAKAPPTAIVNETFARQFFDGRPPLGRRVKSLNVTYEIVGVVKDAKYQDLRQAVMPTMYIPWTQRVQHPSNYYFVVRAASGDPMRFAGAVERTVREVDAGLRIRMMQSYAEVLDSTTVTERLLATLGGFFGLLALLVACLGIFGAMAYQVSRRTNEIGLRMALGASRGGIARLVLREVVVLAAAGCGVGAVGALLLTGLTRKMLFGVSPTDPLAFALAAAVLAIAALMAGWLPARRASRVDAMVALRYE